MLKVKICCVFKSWVNDSPAEPCVLMSLILLEKGTCPCFCTIVKPLLCVQWTLAGRKEQVSHACVNVKALTVQPATGRLEGCHCNVLHLPASLAVQEQGLLERQAKASHCSVLLMLERIHLYQHRTLYIYTSLMDMSCRFTQLAQKLEEIIFISQLLNGEDIKSSCTSKRIQICADPSTAFSKSNENAN